MAFPYGKEKIRGVNLGGWLVLEPWIKPSLFDQFLNSSEPAVDEWTFTQYLGQKEAKRQLTEHWETWVTEKDIARLSTYRINHLRIPIGYWAFDVLPSEPWVTGAFDYLLKAITWAQTYNLKVELDLHGGPGSQNGFDNSGKRGVVEWQTNKQNIPRTLKVLQILCMNTSNYQNTISAINILNEPASWGGNDINITKQFYKDAYEIVRQYHPNALFVIHDAFLPLSTWQGFMQEAPYKGVALDTHIYFVFIRELLASSNQEKLESLRETKSKLANFTSPIMVGEWSLATTDCAKWLNGFNVGARWDGTFNKDPPIFKNATCKNDTNYLLWSPEYKQFLLEFAKTQKDAYEAGIGWFFWNFKTENAPQWNYMLGVEQGWIPL
ncbi:13269_t:CDS:2 [Ambispora gerdemannii]|uniref:13269_t:CDS:1 n=1 Tax=Ambispora gerdemannii TaxID=144530 RepID=A0A9N9BAH7_9GLOM|nr:13269_t:CDS:2 [Ambispora gerdemannii]